jgi:hypothetical protein
MQFYNRISIEQIKLKNGVVEVVVRETMSALPIEEHVALSFAVVSRQGINSIHIGDERITVE